MYIRNSYYSLAYRIFYLCICGYGIYLHLSPNDITQNAHMFSYFTIQCNIFCFIVFFILLLNSLFSIQFKTDFYKCYFTHLNGMALLSIFITFLTFHFVLNGSGFSMAPVKQNYSMNISSKDVFVHYLVPALTLIDWLLFEPKGKFKWYDPILFLIPTVFYFISTVLRCELTSNDYPYSFIDLSKIDMQNAGRFISIFIIVCLSIGYLILALDKLFVIFNKQTNQS